MAAYVVLMQRVDNTDRYRNEYVPGVMPFLQQHGGEVLVASFAAAAAEGEPRTAPSCFASPTPMRPGPSSTTPRTGR